MVDGFCVIMIICAGVYIMTSMVNNDQEYRQALALLIEDGHDISKSNRRLYKSNSGEYVILSFDSNSNLKHDEEESYPDINDAIGKFLFLTGRK
jgi:hypothetical protein